MTRGFLFRRKLIFLLIFNLVFPFHVFALPQGGEVIHGEVAISTPDTSRMTINQQTDKAIINWSRFSIAQPETVQFNQPGQSSIALNRVTGVDPSIIHGSLSANGRVFVINPNGLMVGPTGKINVNSFYHGDVIKRNLKS